MLLIIPCHSVPMILALPCQLPLYFKVLPFWFAKLSHCVSLRDGLSVWSLLSLVLWSISWSEIPAAEVQRKLLYLLSSPDSCKRQKFMSFAHYLGNAIIQKVCKALCNCEGTPRCSGTWDYPVWQYWLLKSKELKRIFLVFMIKCVFCHIVYSISQVFKNIMRPKLVVI